MLETLRARISPESEKVFREDFSDYQAKAEAISRADIYRDFFAISSVSCEGTESPTVLGAKTANELLKHSGELRPAWS